MSRHKTTLDSLRGSSAARRLRTSPLIQASLALFCLAGTLVLYGNWYAARCSTTPYQYAIIVDAGSSHSALVLFRWRKGSLEAIEPVGSCDVDKGIAKDYDGNHQQAAVDLVNCIKSVLFPKLDCATSAQSVPVTVAATAGMRVLNMSSPQETTALFATIERHFKAAKINITSARIISGTEEAFYAWITTNYVGKKLTSGHHGDTYGVTDLGGASMQIAQELLGSKKGSKRKFVVVDPKNLMKANLFDSNYEIFVLSNLCYGVDQAFRRYFMMLIIEGQCHTCEAGLEAACLPRGYTINTTMFQDLFGPCNKLTKWFERYSELHKKVIHFTGTGNAVKCKAELSGKLLNRKYCTERFAYCADEMAYAKVGTYYMMGAYGHTAKGLKIMNSQGMMEKWRFVGMAKDICYWPIPWPAYVSRRVSFKEKFKARTCFTMNYIDAILSDLFYFSEADWNEKLHFDSRIGGQMLDWELGAAVMMAVAQVEAGGGHGARSYEAYKSKPLLFLLYIVPGSVLLFLLAATLMVMLRTRAGRRRGSGKLTAKGRMSKSMVAAQSRRSSKSGRLPSQSKAV